jgi:serine protease AprX
MAEKRAGTRYRGGGHVATVVALVGVAVASFGSGGVAEPLAAAATTAALGPVTFSLSVQPGDPVPLAVVKEKSMAELTNKGFIGQGIDVALIDSGVSPVVGLDQPGKVLYGPDLSNEGGLANLANLDTYGHGTHMAGIIAGNDGAQVVGMAPASRIVSVKVAGATGETDVAQVIAGIDWVIEHRNDNGLNVRVLNLSFGVAGVATSAGDPLSAAVERAWDAGIVVVAAAGNRGNAASGIDSPAISPYVIAVGAIDQFDGSGKTDKIASLSSSGNATRTPDLVAAGRSIVSFRVPGSMLDQLYPSAIVGDRYFRGSGTSQSAAVVSGFAAALLSRNPLLKPDQVKYLLERYAKDLVPGDLLDGSGKVDAGSAAKNIAQAIYAVPQTFPRAITLAGSGGLVAPTGASWSGGTWNGASWSGGVWNGASWSGASWSGATWSAGTWSGATWSGASWSGASWSGASWSGASWSGASWSGASWAGATWSGWNWS